MGGRRFQKIEVGHVHDSQRFELQGCVGEVTALDLWNGFSGHTTETLRAVQSVALPGRWGGGDTGPYGTKREGERWEQGGRQCMGKGGRYFRISHMGHAVGQSVT